MKRWSWDFIILGLAVAFALCVLTLWRAPRVDPLPPSVRTAVTNEQADRARVDSQLIAASLEAEAAQRRQEAATQRAERSERQARIARDRADSLAREAEQAKTARDSALFWHLAYAERTAERDTLLTVIAEQDTALLAANDRARAFQQAAHVANVARLRADSVLDAVVKSATACTVPLTFGRVKCMSRTTAALVGVGVGVGGTIAVRAIRDGRLTIPLR